MGDMSLTHQFTRHAQSKPNPRSAKEVAVLLWKTSVVNPVTEHMLP